MGNLIKLTAPDGGITEYFYDAAGNVISSTDLKDNVTTFSYDALNRLTRVTGADGNVIAAYVYDESGNIIKYINAEGWLSRNDNDSRIGTIIGYDRRGNVTEVREPVKTENGQTFYKLIRYSYIRHQTVSCYSYFPY